MPKSAVQVARRSMVLASLVCRGFMDEKKNRYKAKSLHKRLLEWLTVMNLWEELEPAEEIVIRASLGELSEKEVISCTWYSEGLMVLSWALRRFELHRHDLQIDAFEVADSVCFLWDDADECIQVAQLRNSEELQAYRELCYAIHSRLTDFKRHKTKKNIKHWIDEQWLGVLRIDGTSVIVDNDLAIDGQSLINVNDERIRECESIAKERHRATIWLIENYPIYSLTPADT